MKKLLVAAAMALFASQAMATIENSAHDLSAGNTVINNYPGGNLSSCQYCHAPHNANSGMTGAPLWNRDTYAFTGTRYTSNTLPVAVDPGTNSLTCLSCHDGSTSMGDTFSGSPGWGTPAAPTNTPMFLRFGSDAGPGIVAIAAAGSNGLGDDHPVGVDYPAFGLGDTSGYRGQVAAEALGAKFYGTGTVECASCHDPHGNVDPAVQGGQSDGVQGGESFLRIDARSICAACHIK